MSAHGASAGRAEKCTSGDGLTIPLRLGWPERRCAISWATGRSARQWRIGASAAGSASGAFYELPLRAGRIAPRSDMLRRKVTR